MARLLQVWQWVKARFSRRAITVGALALATEPPATDTLPAESLLALAHREAVPVPPWIEPELASLPVVSESSPPHERATPVWHLKTTILDRLTEYFVCIRQLRRSDPDAYGYFARVGF